MMVIVLGMNSKEEWEKWNLMIIRVMSGIKEKDAINEVNGIENILRLKKDMRILDAPCGYGRHAIELSKKGYRKVYGVDFSSNAIKEARKRAEEENLYIRFLCRDIFELKYKNYFDVILNLYTSFGLSISDEKNLELLKKYHAMLKPNGLFFLEFVNRNIHFPDKNSIEEIVLSKKDIIYERRTLKNGVAKYEHTLFINGSPCLKSINHLKLYSLKELELLLKEANFKLVGVYGDYNGNPYSPNHSPNLISVSKKVE